MDFLLFDLMYYFAMWEMVVGRQCGSREINWDAHTDVPGRDAWAEGWIVEMVRGCWDWTCIFNRETMGLANVLDIRKEGVKKMSRFLVPFLVK